MPINTLNILTEASLYLLLFGITFSNSATEIFAVIIIALFIVRRALLKKFNPPKTPVNYILYAISAIVFITFLRSAYFSESVRGFIRIVKFILLFFALTEYFREDDKRIKRAFWVMMAVACFTFLNGIFQSVYGFDILRHHELNDLDHLRRINASFVHSNDLGGYIIFILPIAFCLFCPQLKKWQRIFLSLNFLLGAYCLFKTSSRGAWLGFFIGLVVYFFFYKRRLSIAVPLVVVLFVIVSPHGFDRIRSLFASEHNTVWERTQLWKGTWEMVKVHPFFGFGVNTFSQYFHIYKPAEYPDLRYTHNSYLQMWSEIGIFGLLAYLGLIFTIIAKALRGMREKLKKGFDGFILLGAITGYIAFLVQSGLDTNLFSLVLTTLFWVMNAYILSINEMLKKKV
jgi:putative inorganic carbon (HCO3(-)) transporter